MLCVLRRHSGNRSSLRVSSGFVGGTRTGQFDWSVKKRRKGRQEKALLGIEKKDLFCYGKVCVCVCGEGGLLQQK